MDHQFNYQLATAGKAVLTTGLAQEDGHASPSFGKSSALSIGNDRNGAPNISSIPSVFDLAPVRSASPQRGNDHEISWTGITVEGGQSKGALDGIWTKGSISGSTLTWQADGGNSVETALTVIADNEFSMDLEGDNYTARIHDD